jgi:hypothetical protein
MAVLLLLVAGAAAAAYAAWGKGSAAKHSALATRPRAFATPGSGALTPTPGGVPAGTAGGKGALAPTTKLPAVPKLPGANAIKPPKIPLAAVTPKITTPAGAGTGASKAPAKSGKEPNSTGGSTATALPAPILLDTNAAVTYNPYAYPAAWFGDPSRAIDGDGSTGWTAQVDPAVAPKMAEGVVIDLRTERAVANARFKTSTPGMTIQIYGANGHTLPGSITDSAWVAVSHSLVVKKKTTTMKLLKPSRKFRFFVYWISRAPVSEIGTAQAPGHVALTEFELFPA